MECPIAGSICGGGERIVEGKVESCGGESGFEDSALLSWWVGEGRSELGGSGGLESIFKGGRVQCRNVVCCWNNLLLNPNVWEELLPKCRIRELLASLFASRAAYCEFPTMRV